MFELLQPIDEAIQTSIQSGWHFSSILDWIMRVFSVIDNHGEIWIAIAVLFLFFKRTRKVGICMGCALLVEVLLCDGILKHIFARPRPYNVLTQFEPLLPRLNSYSFPSGHTMSSFAGSVSLFVAESVYLCEATVAGFFRRHRFGISAIVLAVIISFSRVFLFMHWPSDILAATIIGCIQGALCALAFVAIEKKIAKKRAASLSVENKDAV